MKKIGSLSPEPESKRPSLILDSAEAQEAFVSGPEIEVNQSEPVDEPGEPTPETVTMPVIQPAVNSSPMPAQETMLEAEPEPLVVRAVGAFTVNINGCMRRYSVGELEADYPTAKQLLETNCPVVPVGSAEFSQCPNCKHIYKRA